jgi:hypothetical protein
MTISADIESDFRRNVSEELEIVPDGPDRFAIVTPMAFDDGDLLPVILRKHKDGWYLTDEGHTFLQLTYELEEADFQQPTRKEIINRTLLSFGVQNRDGELVLPISDQKYGDALYTFLQALVKIDDIRYLSREHARSTFIEDVRHMVRRVASPKREVIYNWHDPVRDPPGIYPVDCKVNGSGTPLFIFALANDARVAIAALSLHMFDKWKIQNKSIGIFEDQAKLDSKMVARFTDVCNKPFSNIAVAEKEIVRFFPELGTSDVQEPSES